MSTVTQQQLQYVNFVQQHLGGVTGPISSEHNFHLQRAIDTTLSRNGSTDSNSATLLHLLSASTNPVSTDQKHFLAFAQQQNYQQQQSHLTSSLGLLPAVQQQPTPTLSPSDLHALHSAQILQHVVSCSDLNAIAQHSQQVRRLEVDKALSSSPQRGRKRANLSNMERLELTRTRNREHAKCTRMRKKSRFSDLLLTERMYEDLHKSAELDHRRRLAVLCFFQLRETMLSNGLQPMSAGRAANQKDASAPTEKVASGAETMEDIVENMSTFVFETGSNGVSQGTSLERMKLADLDLVSRVIAKIGLTTSTDTVVKYQVSSDDIGLAPNDVAIVQVTLALKKPLRGPLVSSLFKIQFAPKSDKLRSVGVTTLKDFWDNGDFDHLEDQVSHPSVVSLDADKDARLELAYTLAGNAWEEKLESREDGPGMNY